MADATGQAGASGPVLYRGADPIPLKLLADGERMIVVGSPQATVVCGAISRPATAPGAQVPAGLPVEEVYGPSGSAPSDCPAKLPERRYTARSREV